MVQELSRMVNAYVAGRRSVRDLEIWLASHRRQILQAGDMLAMELADEVDADLIEHGEGILDDSQLRKRLEGYVRPADRIFLRSDPESPTWIRRKPELASRNEASSLTVSQEYEDRGPLTTLRPVTTLRFTHVA